MPDTQPSNRKARKSAKPTAPKGFHAINVRLPDELFAKLCQVAEQTGVTRANAFRLSLERGLTKLAEQLTEA